MPSNAAYLPLDPTGRVIQPGPGAAPRTIVAPARARRLEFTLSPGMSLLDAAADGLARASEQDCVGALLNLAGGGFGPFFYVIPSIAVSPEHAAYYSHTYNPSGETRFETGCLTFGTRAGKPWLHCHGLWTEADGTRFGGHILPEEAMVSQPISVVAWALDGAMFDTRHDKETNFNLLGPETDARHGRGESEAVALRIKSGEDFARALAGVVRSQGWQAAGVVGGVGSLVGVGFADGRQMSPRPTELFVSHGEATRDGAVIDIAGIDHLGERFEGRLAAGNPVLMTMELGLIRTA